MRTKDIPYSQMRRLNTHKKSNIHKFSFIETMPIKTLTRLLSDISQNSFNIHIGEHANQKSQKYFRKEKLQEGFTTQILTCNIIA